MSDENYDIKNYTRDDLLEKLFQNYEVGFQWWWGECDDLYCRIKSIGQLSIIELYIECTTKEQIEKILNSFLEISQNIIDIPIGFIIDRSGYLNENNYNIDDFLVGQTSEIHNHIIAIASDLKEKTTLNFDGHQIDEIMNVIEDSVVVGTKYETREMITIIR